MYACLLRELDLQICYGMSLMQVRAVGTTGAEAEPKTVTVLIGESKKHSQVCTHALGIKTLVGM